MQDPIAFHGLVAYSGQKSAVGLWRALQMVRRCVHIAAADRPIGPVGLVVQGQVTDMFSQDCWSWVDNHGVRHPSNDGEAYREDTPCTHEEYVRIAKWYEAMGNDYTEAFMLPHLIRAVWVKSWAKRDYKTAALSIARIIKADLLEIKDGRTRIWDLYPAHEIPEEKYFYLEKIHDFKSYSA